MNKWFKEMLSEQGEPLYTFNNFNTLDKEDRESNSPLYIEGTELSMTSEHSVRLVQGHKIYEGNGIRLPVWNKDMCDRRIKTMLESGQNHAQFFIEAAAWADKQPDAMHRAWAFDCLGALEQAYDRLEKSFTAKASDAKPKLFGTAGNTTNKPKLFGGLHAKESTNSPATSNAGAS